MSLDWQNLDRWLIGEAWVGSIIDDHLSELCDRIGPRWSSSEAEWQAVHYIEAQLKTAGLAKVALEEYQLDTWAWDEARATLTKTKRPLEVLPYSRCPSCQIQAPVFDVGYATIPEIEAVQARLTGAIAVLSGAYEPFTPPEPLSTRLDKLAEVGAVAALVIEGRAGRQLAYHTATDWRDPGMDDHALPTLAISCEDGAFLRKLAGQHLNLRVVSRFYKAPSANVVGELGGDRWPEEHLLLGGHHDTVYDAPGGNDNGATTIVVMEVARILARLQAEQGIGPGRTIRFVTFGGEEQKLQGSTAYVARHYGSEKPPRLMINLDELATGYFKGLALSFPHLRDLIQAQLDTMQAGLQGHVVAQIDSSGDQYPFLQQGIDAAMAWRWRFHGKHPDSLYGHGPGDTADKVRPGELKAYSGELARFLLRLSHLPPVEWPENPVTPAEVQTRSEAERGTIIRVF